MRLLWCNDLHLEFLEPDAVTSFARVLAEASADTILIGGDISTSTRIKEDLEEIARHVSDPVYFVLGNHDYYRGSIENTRTRVAEACRNAGNLHYLSRCDVVPLTTSACLLGHDGWGDAGAGDFFESTVALNDYVPASLGGTPKKGAWR